MDKCMYCGGTELVRNVRLSLQAEIGDVGLSVEGAPGTEPTYADLCRSCGSITRFHVRTADRRWRVKKTTP